MLKFFKEDRNDRGYALYKGGLGCTPSIANVDDEWYPTIVQHALREVSKPGRWSGERATYAANLDKLRDTFLRLKDEYHE